MRNISQTIREFNSTRLPEMVQLKYRAMRQNPFRFYRGTCHLFYEDFAGDADIPDDTRVWACGDLHLENLGSYKGDNGLVYFDMNDFDESILAPATWEICRLVCSIHLAAGELRISEADADALCKACLDTYRAVLVKGHSGAIETRTAKGLLRYFLEKVACRKNKEFLRRRVAEDKNGMRLKVDKRIYFPVSATTRKEVRSLVSSWNRHGHPARDYQAVDVAFRIAGTGSMGIHRYVVLALEKHSGKYRLIDIKEAAPSSLRPYLRVKQPAWESEAQRVVSIQKRVQFVSPALLDVVSLDGRTFILKELQPLEDKMDFNLCQGKTGRLEKILVTMGEIAAFGQLRSAGRDGSVTADRLIAFGKDSARWEKKMLQYVRHYASQVLKDYRSFCGEYDKGYFSSAS